jgi:hypothetical protein
MPRTDDLLRIQETVPNTGNTDRGANIGTISIYAPEDGWHRVGYIELNHSDGYTHIGLTPDEMIDIATFLHEQAVMLKEEGNGP